MSKHKRIPKETRLKVYQKYDAHCAYCGCDLEYKDMQVDHLEPIYLYETSYESGEAGFLDDIDNLMPSCRMCNFYKSTFTLNGFRERLQTIKQRLEKDFTYRIARRYGIIKEDDTQIKFYFERIEVTK